MAGVGVGVVGVTGEANTVNEICVYYLSYICVIQKYLSLLYSM